jgi:hypothetical protein
MVSMAPAALRRQSPACVSFFAWRVDRAVTQAIQRYSRYPIAE